MASSADPEDVYDEGNWVTEGQSQQVKNASSKAASVESSSLQAAADTCPEVTKRLQSVSPGKILGLDQAIHLSIDCACELCCSRLVAVIRTEFCGDSTFLHRWVNRMWERTVRPGCEPTSALS